MLASKAARAVAKINDIWLGPSPTSRPNTETPNTIIPISAKSGTNAMTMRRKLIPRPPSDKSQNRKDYAAEAFAGDESRRKQRPRLFHRRCSFSLQTRDR